MEGYILTSVSSIACELGRILVTDKVLGYNFGN